MFYFLLWYKNIYGYINLEGTTDQHWSAILETNFSLELQYWVVKLPIASGLNQLKVLRAKAV